MKRVLEMWSNTRVVQVIKWRYQRGLRLNRKYVEKNCSVLFRNARRHFKGNGNWWKRAINAAGIQYNKVRVNQEWNAEKIKGQINTLYAKGVPLNSGYIRVQYPSLFAASSVHFTGWKHAVRASGVSYKKFKESSNESWSKEKIIRLIKKRVKEGKTLKTSRRIFKVKIATLTTEERNYKRLVMAGIRYFKSWPTAIEIAGYDPKEFILIPKPKGYWSEKTVIEGVLERFNDGKSLDRSVVQKEAEMLFHYAIKFFYSWYDAIVAAGLDPEEWNILPNESVKKRSEVGSSVKWLKSLNGKEVGDILAQTAELINLERSNKRK